MSEIPQDEQLSGKVVCDDLSEPHYQQPYEIGGSCVNPRPAQPQAPAHSLDARGRARALLVELSNSASYEPECDCRRWNIATDAFEKAMAAPSAPSDALRDELIFVQGCVVRAAHGLAMALKGKGIDGADLKDTATGVATGLMEVDANITAALAASPSVTREQEINEAWIKGCLAGRVESAADIERGAASLDAEIAKFGAEEGYVHHLRGRQAVLLATAERIRNLPAPPAPKEPQR